MADKERYRIMKNPMGMTIAAVMAVALVGCPEEGTEVEQELCLHLRTGEMHQVTAAETNPPPIAADHRRYEVTLADVGTQKGGSLSLVVEHGGEFIFGLGRDVPLEVRQANGDVVPVESVSRGSAACAELAATHTYELAVGSYTLVLGPTPETTVSIVVEHDEGH
jgi:hypothetical protein